MSEYNVSLEVFPAKNTCHQGCPPCPLAKKPGVVAPDKIDPRVQESFSVFESFVKKLGGKYKLFYNGPWKERNFDLFPKMKDHSLVNEFAGIDLSKIDSSAIDIETVVNDVFETMYWYISTFFSQKLNACRMTMVPEKLYVGEFEKEIISGIARKVFASDILDEFGKFQFEIRSNLVPKKELDRDIAKIELNNELYLNQTVLDLWREGGSIGMRKKNSHYHPDSGEVCMSYAEYAARVYEKYFLHVTNRVIANSSTKIDKEFLLAQAYRNLDEGNIHFAIASQGVMLHHSSVAINNPVMWISHDTFQREMIDMMKSGDIRPQDMEYILLLQNMKIFDQLDFQRGVPVANWIKRFDQFRKCSKFKRFW